MINPVTRPRTKDPDVTAIPSGDQRRRTGSPRTSTPCANGSARRPNIPFVRLKVSRYFYAMPFAPKKKASALP